MCKLIFEENSFLWEGRRFTINDLLDVEFYEFSDTIADDFQLDSWVENELFYTFIQPVYGLKRFMTQNGIKEIQVRSGSYEILCLLLSAAEMWGIPMDMGPALRCKRVIALVKSGILFAASFVYILVKIIPMKYLGSPDNSHSSFSIVRLNQEYEKYEYFRKHTDIYFDYENIKSTLTANKEAAKEGSVYNKFTREARLKWAAAALGNSIRELKKIYAFMKKKLNGPAGEAAFLFYSKRMIHTCYYGEMIDKYFSLFSGKQYITGKIIDRYGLIERKYAKKYNIHVKNYPHGIEYGFKVPAGLAGDEFYATSGFAAAYFNRLYRTDKFRFDPVIMDAMLNRHGTTDQSHEVVFFTEAHEVEINLAIIRELMVSLSASGITLYLKLHPKESEEPYKEFGERVKMAVDFKEAISGNICIARRSTILVEALYNKSKPLAILVDTNDHAIYKNYPSLQDSHIKAFDSVGELADYVFHVWRDWNEGTD